MRWWLPALVACSLPPRPPTPQVVLPAAPACGAAPIPTRTVPADPTSLVQLAAQAQPGDRIELAAGSYDDAIYDLAASGTAEAPIVIAPAPGASVTMRGTVTLHGRAYLELRGIQFDSPSAQAWLQLDGDAHDIALIGNAFDSHAANRSDGAFVGVALAGKRVTLCGNAFGSWLGDEVSADAIDGLLVENNDWSWASAQHALLAIVGHHVVIRGNAFRNPWQRALHITDRSDDDRTDDVLIEHNSFIDSDWITGAPNPSRDEQFMGGNEVVRFLGARGIFRNNLLAGNHEGDNWDCHGILNFQTFISAAGIDTRRFAHFRVYNNTFDTNKTTSIIFYAGPAGLDLDDNKFVANVIAGSEHYAFSICGGTVPWQTYRVADNVIPGVSLHLDGNDLTVAAASGIAPAVFSANVDATPVYVDGTFASRVAADFTSYSLARLDEAFAAYTLTSPGATAPPLARVTSVNGTSLGVDDALWFSDGFGITTGDRIAIGSQLAMVIARDVSANVLVLDAPIAAQVGDPITLAAAPTNAGVWGP